MSDLTGSDTFQEHVSIYFKTTYVSVYHFLQERYKNKNKGILLRCIFCRGTDKEFKKRD